MADPRHFGPAKTLMMEAIQSGVDMESEVVVAAWMQSMVANQSLPLQEALPGSDWPSLPYEAEASGSHRHKKVSKNARKARKRNR